MENCCICNEPVGDGRPTSVLGTKGSNTINHASEQRKSHVTSEVGQRVHQECRRIFCNANEIASHISREQMSPTNRLILRSESTNFDFKTQCLFCSQEVRHVKKRKQDFLVVRTMEFQETVAKQCESRKDDWAGEVYGRISCINDLPAADAVYHQTCSVNFRTGKNKPHHTDNTPHKKPKQGRPSHDERTAAFLQVAQYLEENDEEQTTVSDLVDKMQQYLRHTDVEGYSAVYMKKKLQCHFGDKIIFTELNGKQNVVTFRTTAQKIIHDFYHEKSEATENDKLRIIKTAAKLIQCDIKSVNVESDLYPSIHDFSSPDAAVHYVPDALQILLKTMFTGENVDLKVASIGQAIMQAVRPRVLLVPIQLGLGIQLHHHFASRYLIDTLKSMGLCCSYSEVKRYERSAASQQGTEILNYSPDQHIEYVADNVDHNIVTLDGSGTFHGMGIICTSTPGTSCWRRVPKIDVTTEDIVATGRINIHYFKPSSIMPLVYKPLSHIEQEDPTPTADILWKTSLLVSTNRPSWSGAMQMLQQGNHPGKSSIQFLPMIDMNPGDNSCIYSTLNFVCDHASRYNVTPVLTFDQPLWWKALTIIRSEPANSKLKQIVLRLGGLHTEMSFLGSIGHLMTGSGLHELLEVVYASNSVNHMLSGKAVSRAVRGHLLVDAALNTILLASAYNVPLPTKDNSVSGENQPDDEDEMIPEDEVVQLSDVAIDLVQADGLFHQLLSGAVTLDTISQSDIPENIERRINAEKTSMKDMRTAALWLQYMDMVDILRRFLKAERTGNWALHLQSVYEMLPYFAASGHNLYAKSAYVYLQTMLELPSTHPDVQKRFETGYHVVRRSDRYWAGLSTDLTIEQVLMRSIKTSGGLTRGKGMTEIQRLVWLLSMPYCVDMNDAMQELTGVKYETSDQHKETGKVRQERDISDTLDLLSHLIERNPFGDDCSLHNIANGVEADTSVNVDKAKQVGKDILDSMVGNDVQEFIFRKSKQAVTLGMKASVKINGDSVHVDPQLLFQRLVTVGDRIGDTSTLFKYELSSYPTALFEAPSLPLVANKPVLADAIWKIAKHEVHQLQGEVQYVLDGGALLHHIPWPCGTTYDNICKIYVEYVCRKYDKAVIVFDGYKAGPTIKDATQQRRTGTCTGPNVNFSGDMIASSKKEQFLNNKANKQRFIHLLNEHLEKAGCSTYHASGDADVLIVQVTIESAKTKNTVLVGDDTDLLILLLYHVDLSSNRVIFAPEPKKNSTKNKVWDIQITKVILGLDICQHILFVHAILGCDTTSRVFSLGKGLSLKHIQCNPLFPQQADVFNQIVAVEKKNIELAGEKALLCLYGGDVADGLDLLRYRRFCQRVSQTTAYVHPRVLPPTSAAAKFHSLRVYKQVMDWKGLGEPLTPENWGWEIVAGKCLPVTTNQQPAPKELLELFRCQCKKHCNTSKCTCRKHGLQCSVMCGECRGTSCSNSPKPDVEEGL